MKKEITEEMHLEKEWFKQAREQTVDSLAEFVNHLMNDYQHDYGTICHAVAACAIAAMNAADKTESGSITGFQASFVMFDFIEQTCFTSNKCGLKIINYDDLLYPQYKEKFDKKISPATWEAVQKLAKDLIEEIKNENVHPSVKQHWESIVNGSVPFAFTVEEE